MIRKISKHARERAIERIGRGRYMSDDEIILLSQQPVCKFRFIWEVDIKASRKAKTRVKVLKTVIPIKGCANQE